MTTVVRSTIGAAALLAIAGAAAARPNPSEAAAPALDVASSVQRLGAESFADREEASEALHSALGALRAGGSASQWPEIERRLVQEVSREGASPEARARVLSALRRLFFESSRGAIGISFAQRQPNGPEVLIQQVHKGFPAGDAGLLVPGDVILDIDGVPISGSIDFTSATRRMVCSRDPGEVVTITVQRRTEPEGPGDGVEQLTIDVPLGSFDALLRPDFDRAQQIGLDALEAAWQVRLERLGGAAGDDGLTTGAPGGGLGEAARPARATRMDRARLRLAGDAPGANEAALTEWFNAGDRVAMSRPSEALGLARVIQRGGAPGLRPMVVGEQEAAGNPRRQLLTAIEQEMERRTLNANRLRMLLQRDGVTPAQRARMQAQSQQELEAVNQLRQQIADLTREIEAEREFLQRRAIERP